MSAQPDNLFGSAANDADSQETREWVDALSAVIATEGRERGHFLLEQLLEEARQQGWVATLEGRRRPLPEIRSPRGPERAAAERTAINHPIQGTAADIMKIAMLAIHKDLPTSGLKARMTMQVHDELVFEVPDDEVQALADFVRTRMRDVPTSKLNLRVPLEVEVEVGHNWNDGEEVK